MSRRDEVPFGWSITRIPAGEGGVVLVVGDGISFDSAVPALLRSEPRSNNTTAGVRG